jgi:hypothetical protein
MWFKPGSNPWTGSRVAFSALHMWKERGSIPSVCFSVRLAVVVCGCVRVCVCVCASAVLFYSDATAK